MNPLVMSRKYLVTAAFLALLATPAQAVPVIDQNQPSGTDVLTIGGPLAQSFQQTADNVSGAGFFMFDCSCAPSTLMISLWDALPNDGGNLLTSGSGTATPNSFFDVFWAPVAVALNTTLFLVVDDISNSGSRISASLSDPYANGEAYRFSTFDPFPDGDFAFRTYAEIDLGGGRHDVPEPLTLGLLGAGLAGLGVLRRRL